MRARAMEGASSRPPHESRAVDDLVDGREDGQYRDRPSRDPIAGRLPDAGVQLLDFREIGGCRACPQQAGDLDAALG